MYIQSKDASLDTKSHKEQLIYFHKKFEKISKILKPETLSDFLIQTELVYMIGITRLLLLFPIDDLRLMKEISYLQKPTRTLDLKKSSENIKELHNYMFQTLKMYLPQEFKSYFNSEVAKQSIFIAENLERAQYTKDEKSSYDPVKKVVNIALASIVVDNIGSLFEAPNTENLISSIMVAILKQLNFHS